MTETSSNSVLLDLFEDPYVSVHNVQEKGDDVQKFSVLQTLPQLLEADPRATVSRLIPKILQELPNSSCEFHIMCSKVFRTLIEKRVGGVNLLSAVLQGIETWDPIVASAWMDTLIAVIEFLSEVNIKAEIIPLAHNKSLLTMPVTSRIACCRILGKVAVHRSLHPNEVKREVLPLVQSLCQDCNADVRAAICAQLPFVAQGLGNDPSKDSLIVCLVELASDDAVHVKAAAVAIIVPMLSHTTPETIKNTILPLVTQVCSRILTTDDISVISISKEFGTLLEGLKPALTHADNVWFLNFYKTLCRRGIAAGPFQPKSVDVSANVVCRENCAANLPLVCRFVLNSLQAQTESLYTIIHDLACDPCYLVRQMVAHIFLDLMIVFAVQCKGLKLDLVRILRDDSEEVLQKIVPHISGLMQVLCRYAIISTDIVNPNSADIGRALLKCYFDLINGYNWRLLTNYLYQIECLPFNMPSDYIHQHFTPVILSSTIHGKAKPVRTQAARTLLVFLRYNKKDMHRRWLRENLISQLCQSKSSYTRLIYIRLCQSAIDLFSEKYFKQYFMESLLGLADDPVPNVRLCVVNMFAVLKPMLILPSDRVLHDKFEAAFSKIKADEKDRDVLNVYQKQLKLIININRSLDKDARAKEEKRRQDEEEQKDTKIAPAQPVAVTRRNVPMKKVKLALEPEPTSVPQNLLTASGNQLNSNMPFLEQNFYIDAGISLATLSKQTTDLIDNKLASLNVTDDDKVTLRNAKRTKRYSSILSTNCLEQPQKPVNRHSLNIDIKRTVSKIPISNACRSSTSSGFASKTCRVSIENESSDGSVIAIESSLAPKGSCNAPSQLPILKRRPKFETRKIS